MKNPFDFNEDTILNFNTMRPMIGGLSRSTVWRLEQEGKFPSHVRIFGTSRIGWRLPDVIRWQRQQHLRSRRNGQ